VHAREGFDYIVVGAGSAGCALAARLSEQPEARVLLLEAGPWDWNPVFHIPLASGKALRDGWYGWQFPCEADEGLGGRALTFPRGRVMGGSSSINGMVYIRGNAADFDQWAADGNAGWSYSDVLPLFKKSECHQSRRDSFHGTSGELGVSTAAGNSEVFGAFIEAGVQAGFARNLDFNGQTQNGFGFFDFTIAHGRRSSSTAFLHAARRRRNLTIRPNSTITRVILVAGKAVGVEYVRGSRRFTAYAAETILCAGSIKSPQLLMLSGIGDPAKLRQAGVTVQHALAGVGKNLQDHAHVPVQFACSKRVTMYSMIRADRIAWSMARAVVLRNGPAASFPTEAGAFTCSDGSSGLPDIQYHLINALGLSRVRFPWARRTSALDQEGFTISVCLLQPQSKGEVSLRTSDPLEQPRIRTNWFSERRDLGVIKAGVEQLRHVASRSALAPYIGKPLNVNDATLRGRELEEWVRASCGSVHHQIGTCKMGHDETSVVDAQLRVHGVPGLRVADASIMPTLVRGNTNAASIMVGEKAAQILMRPHTIPMRSRGDVQSALLERSGAT
jgi:choline dehydrogenase